jgi:AraC-like DNA-binding protein
MTNMFQCEECGSFKFEPELPSNYAGKVLPGSRIQACVGDPGSIILQEVMGHQFSIRYSVIKFFKKMVLHWKEESALRIQSVLAGVFSYHTGKRKITLRPGEMNVVWAPNRTSSAIFQAGKKYEIFQIAFAEELVQELAPDFQEQSTFPPEKNKFWMGVRQDKIMEILKAPYTNNTLRFFHETRARELLFDCQTHPRQEFDPTLTSDEISRLHLLDQFILSDLRTHHTIPELAKRARMAEGKLKWSFKKVIGTSLYDRYREAKLQEAVMLLLETDMQIKNIYEQIGYETIASFSDAFKARFGIRPLQFRKKFKPRP